jgi:Ras GTPase-activating protein 3
MEVDLLTQLDPARDLQRLHTLITSNSQTMKLFYDRNSGNTEEMNLTKQSLTKIFNVAIELEKIHRKHRNKEMMEMKLGSQQEPIGDDNYLRGMSSTSLNSGASTTPRSIHTQNNSEFLQPALFHRGHFQRSSDSERFSQHI